MPKAPVFSEDDEEKTTIESGWEEEASTTVEQGDVADKIRALGVEPPRPRNNVITNVTNTNGGGLDEPTVDDQRANAAIAMIAPPALTARLLITQGNDTGQQIEVLPGKNYTIGRAIDNDFVLTDIAVSRKHFDLRHEAGTWVLADRGSGNGTLVNGNIEDQPFMLANGDTIEIGNTTFRFEQVNGEPRPVEGTYDVELDEEPSTVAGKPLRNGEAASARVPATLRPKTVPPPAPRARPPSTAPPLGYPINAQGAGPHLPGIAPPRPLLAPELLPQLHVQPAMSLPQLQPPPQPATTLPMPQMTNRPPILGVQPPTILGDPKHAVPLANVLSSTIPGQVPPVGQHKGLPHGYPNLADMAARGAMVANSPGRDATSTALVQPTPYGMIPPSQPVSIAPAPQLSRRTKLLLAGAALAVLAAIATIAIIKGSSDKDPTGKAPAVRPTTEATPAAKAKPMAVAAVAKVDPAKPGSPDAPKPGASQAASAKPDAPKPDASQAASASAKPDAPKPDASQFAAKPDAPKPDARPASASTKPDAPKLDAPKPDPKIDSPTPRPAVELARAPRGEPSKPKVDPRTRRNQTVRNTTPPKSDPPRNDAPRTDPATTTRPRVAGADSTGVKGRANELYRNKRFNDASAILRAASASGPPDSSDTSDLRNIASIYEQFGRAYNRGMSPGAKPVEAYVELRKALNLENNSAGGAFKDEVQRKLAQVAPRAAISFYTSKDYESSYLAVRIAEQFGSKSGDLQFVRQNLESIATQLYNTAAKELATSPDEAKAKLRQIKAIIDSKSPTWIKANKLLTSS